MADKAWYTVTVYGPNKQRVELELYESSSRAAEGRAEGYARRTWGGTWVAGLVKGPYASSTIKAKGRGDFSGGSYL